MDFTTIAGIVASFGLILFGILFDSTTGAVDPAKIMFFIDVPSILITVGGTLAILFACFPLKTTLKTLKHFPIILGLKKYNPKSIIDNIVDYAQVARVNGLLVLEEKANQETDPFIKSGIMLIVDAVDASKVQTILETDLINLNDRHEECIAFYEKGAALGPAMGMIGTLIGLVIMLKQMGNEGGGADTLGLSMSVALITTFYGSVMANCIFVPIANKLRMRNQEEILCKQIIIEGILSIQAGENPKYINEKLSTYLEQKERGKEGKKGKKGDKSEAVSDGE